MTKRLQKTERLPNLHGLRLSCCGTGERIDQSINYLVDLIRRQPNAAWAHHLLGRELTHRSRKGKRLVSAEAYELDPSNPLYLADLADNCNRSRYGDEGAHIQSAYELARKFLEQGHETQAYSKILRDIFLRCGDFATVETIGSFDELGKFWALKGDASALHLLLGRVTSPEQRRQLIQHHRLWGELIEQKAARSPLKHVNRRTGVRAKFRVGFMSSDLRNHPVSYFVLPLIEGYDRSRFEFYCYSFYTGKEDAVQKRIRQRVDMFRLAPGVSPREAAQIIADDDLDIVFELGGTTAMNKLEAMAWKPAPLQVSWLGYPHSSWAYDHRRNPGRPLSQTAGSSVADREALRTSPQLGHSWPAKLSIRIAD